MTRKYLQDLKRQYLIILNKHRDKAKEDPQYLELLLDVSSHLNKILLELQDQKTLH